MVSARKERKDIEQTACSVCPSWLLLCLLLCNFRPVTVLGTHRRLADTCVLTAKDLLIVGRTLNTNDIHNGMQ